MNSYATLPLFIGLGGAGLCLLQTAGLDQIPRKKRLYVLSCQDSIQKAPWPKLLIGSKTLKGLGAGRDTAQARRAVAE